METQQQRDEQMAHGRGRPGHEAGQGGSRTGLDPEEDLMDVFLEESAGQLDAALDALARGDARALRAAAHALRGSAGLMGFTELEADAAAVEDAAARARRGSDLAPEVERLGAAVARVLGAARGSGAGLTGPEPTSGGRGSS